MICAVYIKNKPKDKWTLYSVAESMEVAKKKSRNAVRRARKIGFSNPESIVQGYESVHDIPKVLGHPKPEKNFYN